MAKVRHVIVRRIRAPGTKVSPVNRPPNGLRLLDNNIIQKFNPSMLELGDISAPCQEKEAVVAVFDLTGFTAFCNQVDSYLAIPRFLNDFLEWFFRNIREKITEEDFGDRSAVWTGLPVMVKFLGDGLILLWDARKMSEEQICRLAGALYTVCQAYRAEFYPQISTAVNKPPSVLRCGVARGKVFGIGNDKEYVGHCINNASRLSHLGSLTFCFPHRGFQVREHMPAEYRRIFAPKSVSIRGVGENELVWVVKEEFDNLPLKNRAMFRSIETVGSVN
jgi:class 3 adenylate cyclase